MILIKIIKKISELKVETDLNSRATSSPAQVGKSRPASFSRKSFLLGHFAICSRRKAEPFEEPTCPFAKIPERKQGNS